MPCYPIARGTACPCLPHPTHSDVEQYVRSMMLDLVDRVSYGKRIEDMLLLFSRYSGWLGGVAGSPPEGAQPGCVWHGDLGVPGEYSSGAPGDFLGSNPLVLFRSLSSHSQIIVSKAIHSNTLFFNSL